MIDLTLVYKIVHKLVCLEFESFFVLNTNNRTRGHNFKLCLPRCNSKKRQNFFAIRIIPAWNSLPVESVNAVSVNSFKRSLDSINFAPFLSRAHDRFVVDLI